MNLPEPPTNVRVITHDDVEHAVEVVYRGIDEDGLHVWVATTRWRGTPIGIACDRMPARTSISVEFAPW